MGPYQETAGVECAAHFLPKKPRKDDEAQEDVGEDARMKRSHLPGESMETARKPRKGSRPLKPGLY